MVGLWCLGAKHVAEAGKCRLLMHLTDRATGISLTEEQEKLQKMLRLWWCLPLF